MGQFKTIQVDNSIKRVFLDGYLKVNSVDKDKNYKVSLMLLNGKRNRNGWVYEGINERLNQFVNIPILCALVEKNGVKKAGGHDFEIRKDPKTGEEYASFIGAESEHIIGWITEKTPDGRDNSYMENIDGVEWVCIREALLPSFYNKEFIDEMDKNGGTMRVSIETLVYKNRIEGDTEYEMDWVVVGVTVISVTEAVAGAKMKRKVNAYSEELEKIKLKVASLNAMTNIEPQTQKTKNQKGETRTMAKVYRMDELKDKFPNYTVLGVNGNNVALLSSKGRTCSYTFLENEDTVVPERIEEIAVNSIFGAGEGAVSVSAETLVGEALAQLNAAQKALETKTNECLKLQGKIDKMNATETERRKKVVKDAIQSKLNELMEHCEGIDANTCDDMLTDAKIAEYAAMEDEHGFCGDKVAEKEVNSRCMDKILALEKTKSKNNHYSWTDTVHGIVADEEQDDILENVKNILD